MKSGGQPDNDNAKKGMQYNSALKRALARSGNSVDGGLNKVCDQLVKAAIGGEQWAIKEVADRIDGRPAQTNILLGDEDNPVAFTKVVREIVDPKDTDS